MVLLEIGELRHSSRTHMYDRIVAQSRRPIASFDQGQLSKSLIMEPIDAAKRPAAAIPEPTITDIATLRPGPLPMFEPAKSEPMPMSIGPRLPTRLIIKSDIADDVARNGCGVTACTVAKKGPAVAASAICPLVKSIKAGTVDGVNSADSNSKNARSAPPIAGQIVRRASN